MRARVCAASALLLVACAACAGPSSGARASAASESRREALAPGVWDVAAGRALERGEFARALSGARYVLVGESHDEASHHAAQLEVYEAVAAAAPGLVHLGMEMFARPSQGAIDAWLGGEIGEEAMLERVEWERSWGFDAAMYAPLWRAAKSRGARVVALNLERRLTRRIAEVGLGGLSEEERGALPEIDLGDDGHRAWFEGVMFGGAGAHGGEGAGAERYYAAQVAWDEAMAEAAYEFGRAMAPGDRLVVLAGSGHVSPPGAIAARLARRAGSGEGIVRIVPCCGGRRGGPLAPSGRATRADLERWRAERAAEYVIVIGEGGSDE